MVKGQKQDGKGLGVNSAGFKDFLLRPELLRAIGEAGFEHPSQVQQEVIPVAILGEDIICQAKSGMGKTAVFCLSILHQIQTEQKNIQALIITHTRELAFQINKEFERLGKYITGLKSIVIYGGEDLEVQVLKLESQSPQIVVGTPGRLLHLIKEQKVDLSSLKFFVIDECDRVLEQYDMRQDVQEIFIKTKPKKQVMVFSATLSEKAQAICKKFMKNKILEILIDD